ncbi:MAG: archaeal heat shock protein Hsp20 [Thermoproteota archaeon]
MDRIMEEVFREFRDFATDIPKELVREKRLPDGSTVREMGPFVYGYSVTVGPDGKPIVREFGNIKPGNRPSAFGPRPIMEVKGKREPLTDVIEEEEVVRIITEVPGVEKSDIKLDCTEESLTISVDTEKRKYYKEVELPSAVDPKSAKATYKNGILEIVLNKTKKKTEGHRINID